MADGTWLSNLFSGLIGVFLVLSVPAVAGGFKRRRAKVQTADASTAVRLETLEKDRNLVFDWLLGPMGFDGKRRGGFMETDATFKSELLTQLRNGNGH